MSIGPGGSGTRAISKRYPVTSGLTAETTKQEGRQKNLLAESTIVRKRERAGIDG